jgi:hypothetical protein
MIDAKLNEIPVKSSATDKDRRPAEKAPRGLSINDTIAAAANKSVGARGTDTSKVTAGLAEQDPSERLELPSVSHTFTDEEIAARAFECWQDRGCPVGSPEIDWEEAQRDLRARQRGSKSTAASA